MTKQVQLSCNPSRRSLYNWTGFWLLCIRHAFVVHSLLGSNDLHWCCVRHWVRTCGVNVTFFIGFEQEHSREQTFDARSWCVRTGSFQRASVRVAFEWRSNEPCQEARVRGAFDKAFERQSHLCAFLACKTLVFHSTYKYNP